VKAKLAPAQEGTDRDLVLHKLEQAEKRVVACSFLVAKIVSVVALLLTLLLLEAGMVARVWETEFGHPEPSTPFVHGKAVSLAPLGSAPEAASRLELKRGHAHPRPARAQPPRH
jgi:hypothetical protein